MPIKRTPLLPKHAPAHGKRGQEERRVGINPPPSVRPGQTKETYPSPFSSPTTRRK